MSLREVTHKLDRTGWLAGPWDNEPDKLNWTTRAGLPGMIVRNHGGALCGYAAVDASHPWYRKDYDDIDVEVHGGLTYAAACRGVICHVPEPGKPDDVWWFGFDCHHLGDFAPAYDSRERGMGWDSLEHPLGYKTVAYVREEVECLADQLVAHKEG